MPATTFLGSNFRWRELTPTESAAWTQRARQCWVPFDYFQLCRFWHVVRGFRFETKATVRSFGFKWIWSEIEGMYVEDGGGIFDDVSPQIEAMDLVDSAGSERDFLNPGDKVFSGTLAVDNVWHDLLIRFGGGAKIGLGDYDWELGVGGAWTGGELMIGADEIDESRIIKDGGTFWVNYLLDYNVAWSDPARLPHFLDVSTYVGAEAYFIGGNTARWSTFFADTGAELDPADPTVSSVTLSLGSAPGSPDPGAELDLTLLLQYDGGLGTPPGEDSPMAANWFWKHEIPLPPPANLPIYNELTGAVANDPFAWQP